VSTRLIILAATLAAAVTAPFVVSAAGAPTPDAKAATAPITVAAVSAPAPKPAPVAAAPVAAERGVDCGRRVRVVYPGYATPAAPAACTASR
jgi:hypothetical protein